MIKKQNRSVEILSLFMIFLRIKEFCKMAIQNIPKTSNFTYFSTLEKRILHERLFIFVYMVMIFHMSLTICISDLPFKQFRYLRKTVLWYECASRLTHLTWFINKTVDNFLFKIWTICYVCDAEYRWGVVCHVGNKHVLERWPLGTICLVY